MKNKIQKIISFITAPASLQFTLFCGFCIFLFSFWLIARDNGFFSGDMAIIGTITEDIAHRRFFSWYFYGQNYFGNLEPLFLAILTRFTGNSINALYFCEHLFYFVAISFLLFSIKKKSRLQILLTYFISFFGIRHIYPYTYYPQGFAFISMIMAFYYYLFHRIEVGVFKLKSRYFFLVGFTVSLSLWYNPLLLIIALIFGIIYISKILSRKYSVRMTDIVSGVVGLLLGSIPFILATLSTKSQNLLWFSGNTSTDRVYSLWVPIKDFLFYFINYSLLDTSSGGNLLKSLLFNPRNFVGLIFTILSIYVVVRYIITHGRGAITKTCFLLFIFIMVANKEYLPTAPIFQYIRYPMFLYMIYVFLIVTISFHLLKNGAFGYKAVALFLLVFLMAGSFLQIEKKYIQANRGLQFYEIIYGKLLYEYDARYLYCDNFYDACSSIAFLGKDRIDVQLINTTDSNADRNPRAKVAVDRAVEDGEKVLSLIRKDKLNDSHVILEEFCMAPGAPVYYLIDGSYK